jgi:hypothetical protein
LSNITNPPAAALGLSSWLFPPSNRGDKEQPWRGRLVVIIAVVVDDDDDNDEECHDTMSGNSFASRIYSIYESIVEKMANVR